MNQKDWDRITEQLEFLLEHPEQEEILLALESPEMAKEIGRLLRAARASSAVEPAAHPPRRVDGRYERLKLLGSGGSGEAWLSVDCETGQHVVLKMPLHWEWFREGLARRFLAEAEVLRRLEHPGIVGMLASGTTAEGEPYLVMPYVDGVSLRAMLDAGPMELGVAAGILEQLGEALGAAHRASIIHRDLKPENVMLRDQGPDVEVVLIDFGIAQVADLQTGGGTTTKFFGTTRYMAPEQLLGQPVLASDVYALALLAYEMVTGTPLFVAEGPVALYEEQRKLRESGLSSALPQHVREALWAGLRWEAGKRPKADVFGRDVASAMRTPPGPWRPNRRMVLSGAGTFSAIGGAYAYLNRPIPLEERRLLYRAGQTYGARGWRAVGKVDLDVTVFDTSGKRLLGNRLVSSDQGAYILRLSERVIRAGHSRPWRLTGKVMPIHGSCNFGACFGALGVRYSMAAVIPDVGEPCVDAPLTYTPEITRLSHPAPLRADRMHELVMIFDPAVQAATVYLDGQKMLSGYRGTREYATFNGVGVGFSVQESKVAEGIFGDLAFVME